MFSRVRKSPFNSFEQKHPSLLDTAYSSQTRAQPPKAMTSLERKPSTANHSPIPHNGTLTSYLQVKKNSAPSVKLITNMKQEVKATRKIESIMSMKALRTEMERTQVKLGEKKTLSKSPPNRLIYLGT